MNILSNLTCDSITINVYSNNYFDFLNPRISIDSNLIKNINILDYRKIIFNLYNKNHQLEKKYIIWYPFYIKEQEDDIINIFYVKREIFRVTLNMDPYKEIFNSYYNLSYNFNITYYYEDKIKEAFYKRFNVNNNSEKINIKDLKEEWD